jgi:type VI secretion system Hcp family effector
MKKNQLNWIVVLVMALQFPVLFASAQTEPVVAYVTIKTYTGAEIKGSSTIKGQEGAIECLGYSYTMKTTLNIGSQSSGVGAGKMGVIIIQMVKHVDASSPTLKQMLINGQAIKSLTIEVLKKGEQPAVLQKLEFDLVGISQITEYAGVGNDKSNTVPDEQLTLEASKVVVSEETTKKQ